MNKTKWTGLTREKQVLQAKSWQEVGLMSPIIMFSEKSCEDSLKLLWGFLFLFQLWVSGLTDSRT